MSPQPKQGVLSKLPIVGEYRRDKSAKQAQEEYFATLHADSSYIEPEPTVLGWIKSQGPTKDGVINYIADTFPCSRWVCNYNLTWLLGDVIAGVTVGAVVVPQGMAYAKLADLPVQYGLYTSFIGGLLYWIFGTSKDIAVGPVAVASIMTGTIVADLEEHNPGNKLSHQLLAGLVAMFSGMVLTLLGALRLGWLVDLISLPALAAFITGSAITISLGQIPAMLGMRKINSRESAIAIGVNIFKHLDRIRIDAAFGISALVLLYLIKWTCAAVIKRKPNIAKALFFVSTLRTVVVILMFTIISYILNHSRKDDPLIRILGFIPRGLQPTPLPRLEMSIIKSMLGQLPTAILVLLIEHMAIGKELGRLSNYTINPNSELIALGVVNIFGPMLGAYAATGSFSRTVINSKAGARTPMSGLVTGLVVIVAIYTMTPAFFFVPRSALAAVIIHAIGDSTYPINMKNLISDI
jgi:solute carrier family 26 (sodium-independent sulfate anion transporter), member 11